MLFGIPMVLQEPMDHCTDCYFCLVNTQEYNKENKCKMEYPSLQSATRPVSHTAEIPDSQYRFEDNYPLYNTHYDEERSNSNDL